MAVRREPVGTGKGCLKSPVDLRDFKLRKKTVMAGNYPEEYEVSMVHSVKNQGNVGSCVAHTCSEIVEYHDNNKHKMSTNFIYGIHKKLFGSDGPGMYPREAAKILVKYGDMLYEDCTGNTEVDTVYNIANEVFNDQEKMARAYKNKMEKYVALKTADDIKFALMNYGPVLFCTKWYDRYTLEGNILKFDYSTGYGGHAIMVYGWDKDGWKFQNSWGTMFGKKGCAVLPYSHGFYEVYGLVDDKTLSSDSDIVNPTYDCDVLGSLFKLVNLLINIFKRN